jgi:hypothetical protein
MQQNLRAATFGCDARRPPTARRYGARGLTEVTMPQFPNLLGLALKQRLVLCYRAWFHDLDSGFGESQHAVRERLLMSVRAPSPAPLFAN